MVNLNHPNSSIEGWVGGVKIIFTPPTQPSIDELGWFRFTICRVEELQGIPLIVSRTGYTGELGYEVWCHPKHAPEVWDKLMEAGKEHGIIPAGFAALDKLRIEAGLILFGAEFDGQQDPFEAGIGFAVPLKTKEDDFIGKEELKKRKENPQKKLVGLELIGKSLRDMVIVFTLADHKLELLLADVYQLF